MMKYKLIALIIILSAFIFANIYTGKDKVVVALINEDFPYEIENWIGTDIKADESVYKMLDREEFLFRVYENIKTKQQIVLSIVLTNKRDHIHDIHVCYTGQGIHLEKENKFELENNTSVNYILGKRDIGDVDIFYWYTDLNKIFTSRVEFMKEISIAKFLGKPSNGFALVTMMTVNNDKSQQNLSLFAEEVYKQFKASAYKKENS